MKVIIGLLAASLAVLAGFFGGFKAGENHSSSSSTAAQVVAGTGSGTGTTGGGGLFPGGGRFGGGNGGAACSTTSTRALATGSVTKVEGSKVTVHDNACNTNVVVTLGGDTRVRKTIDGQASDVTSGERVTIVGTRNADGSITAQTVTINPAGGAGFGGGGPGGAPTPSPGG